MSTSADRVSAVATGIGIGFVAFMATWIVGARVGEQVWNEATGAVVAMGVALVALVATSVIASRRLLRTVKEDAERT